MQTQHCQCLGGLVYFFSSMKEFVRPSFRLGKQQGGSSQEAGKGYYLVLHQTGGHGRWGTLSIAEGTNDSGWSFFPLDKWKEKVGGSVYPSSAGVIECSATVELFLSRTRKDLFLQVSLPAAAHDPHPTCHLYLYSQVAIYLFKSPKCFGQLGKFVH